MILQAQVVHYNLVHGEILPHTQNKADDPSKELITCCRYHNKIHHSHVTEWKQLGLGYRELHSLQNGG